MLQVGDKLPDVTLFESSPGDKVKLTDVFAGACLLSARAMGWCSADRHSHVRVHAAVHQAWLLWHQLRGSAVSCRPRTDTQHFVASSSQCLRCACAGKKGVLFGVPGAYTPGCSKVSGASKPDPCWHVLPVPQPL